MQLRALSHQASQPKNGIQFEEEEEDLLEEKQGLINKQGKRSTEVLDENED